MCISTAKIQKSTAEEEEEENLTEPRHKDQDQTASWRRKYD
jgi:hypothetical protein